MKRCFVTGCDNKAEWMLKWFLKNYTKHNNTPIVFADFGVTKEMKEWIHQVSEFDHIVDVPKQKHNGWFLKPRTMQMIDAEELCWLDTDIQIFGDMSGVFKYVEEGKLGMVKDRPWTKRTGEEWYNSGVVAMRGKPPILKQWVDQCSKNPSRGDQETLHEMLRWPPMLNLMHISEIPNKYNWLRVQLVNDREDNPNKIAMHWTGHKGKLQIEKLIYNEQL